MFPLLVAPAPPGARAVFTTRTGGQSLVPYAELNLGDHVGDDARTVAANRAALAAAIGLPVERLAFMEQVHGREVAVVLGPAERPPVADALVTRARGLALVVLVADCAPVLLVDAEAGVIAAAHAGRPGVALGVVPAAVGAMVDLGAVASRVHAWVGPTIGGCCYEVPAAMQAEVGAAAPGSVRGDPRTRAGTPALDLRAGIADQLTGLGITQVGQIGGCTSDDGEFFSYRRDGSTGRQAGLIWLDP